MTFHYQCGPRGLLRGIAGVALSTILVVSSYAQDGGTASENTDATTETQTTPDSVVAMRDAQLGLEAVKTRIATIKEKLAETEDETESERLQESLKQLEEDVGNFRRQMETVATGLDPEDFAQVEPQTTTWSEQVRDVVSPALDAMSEFTEESRQTQELRKEIEKLTSQRDHARQAVANLKENIELVTDEQLREQLKEYLQDWELKLTKTVSQLKVAQYQLNERTENAPSLFDAASSGLAGFFRSRGLNLLVAFAVVILIYLGGRYGHRMIIRYGPMHRKDRLRSFGTRLFDLSWTVGTLLLSVAGLLITFYMFDDWVLLSLALIFLLGIAWAGKETLPGFYQQGKLLLNLGPVREGERIVYEGVPWKVGRLGFYTDLTNPALEGAVIRLSANDLLEMHSRPMHSIEPWFPTEEDDWILLNDIHAKVVKQTPEYVRILQLGGARITYPSSDFIAAAPINLTHNFRVSMVFGIDYMHQEICTTKVPEIFEARITRELGDMLKSENVINVNAEFSCANSSSLDYTILADINGKVASRLRKIERAIQRICVDVCNEEGWVIPFTQVTVHQAEASAAAAETTEL